MNVVTTLIRVPPEYCQYADGPCDQLFEGVNVTRGVVLYPSQPEEIASTIEGAVGQLRLRDTKVHWRTWKQMQTVGQVIFCEICKNIRFTDVVVADVTTLNLNLLFEIGFALGLELPVVPIRDTTFARDKNLFEELGLLDTVGYLDFVNSADLSGKLAERLPVLPIPTPPATINTSAPLYVIKGPIDTDGAVRMLSVLKKSPLRFRTYDAVETPRLSLHDARKQVASSIGVVANFLHPDREGALVHNARVALIGGLAMASRKVVLLLQEGAALQPIDYRDVVARYTSAGQVEKILERLIRPVLLRWQDSNATTSRPPVGLLEKLDIGDVAAENEIQSLQSYFVPTAQYNDAKRGYARLVVGRKGSGKTAIFYGIRASFGRSRSHVVLDLKPEGHQFLKLREVVLSKLSPGLQEHTMVAFWNYILLCELAQKIRDTERVYAQHDPERRRRFEKLLSVYDPQVPITLGDFSERLLRQVDLLAERFRSIEGELSGSMITQALFRNDIRALDEALAEYLGEKEEVWVLVDNLDKSWPTRGATDEDILILRSLLEATRKLQRQLERRSVSFHSLVFLRNDIYEHLLKETSDKGKDTAVILDWPDVEVLRELVRRRLEQPGDDDTGRSFEVLWSRYFSPNVDLEDSFRYIIARTLMRPRDLLNFLHRALEVSINRGHKRVESEDVKAAELLYSEDILVATAFELKDVFPGVPDPLYVFLGCPAVMSADQVKDRLAEAGIDAGRLDDALKLLIWFGVLGVRNFDKDEVRYSYEVRYNVDKLMAALRVGNSALVVHPAFRIALECEV